VLIVAVAVIVAIAVSGGSRPYELQLRLDNALGLRDGSKVVIGGVQVGTAHTSLTAHDKVVVRLDIDSKYAPLGRDATATVTSVNLLGQKSLELNPGNRGDPASSGFELAAARVTPSTDLDQVLNVLDDSTRARLTVLVNEAGAAFADRRWDVASLLQQLPSSLTQGTALLRRLVADHHSLADLVTRTDGFVNAVTGQRQALVGLLDTFGRTTETFSAKQLQLRATLARLPATLETARSFLTDLRQTTIPLGPAATDLQRTAGPLAETLARVAPFTRSATPALAQARTVAPALTRLATGATPVLHASVPTLSSLAQLSLNLVPVSDTLMRSADNIVGTAANWAHAIQFRDGLSHVFRAEVSITPQTLNSLVDRLVNYQKMGGAPKRPTPAAGRQPASPGSRQPSPGAGTSSAGMLPSTLTKPLSGLLQGLGNVLPLGAPPQPGTHDGGNAVTNLLNFLLR
jgi:virulence factor Mce-like protein